MTSNKALIFICTSTVLLCVSAAPHDVSSGLFIEDQIQLINGPEQTHHFVGVIGDTTHIRHHPYMAAVFARTIHFGSAAIINKDWVLTNGWVASGEVPSQVLVRAGSDSAVEKGQSSFAAEIIYHPKYKNTWEYDFALIKLESPLNFNKHVKPIEIANSTPRSGSKGSISGFGYARQSENNKNKIPAYPFLQDGRLREATQEVMSYEDCKKYYEYKDSKFTNGSFCTTPKTDSGPCTYDTGSPLVIDNELTGLLSNVRECTSTRYPPVFADITQMKGWILETIRNRTLAAATDYAENENHHYLR